MADPRSADYLMTRTDEMEAANPPARYSFLRLGSAPNSDLIRIHVERTNELACTDGFESRSLFLWAC